MIALIPAPLLNTLQRLRLKVNLALPYSPMPFSLSDLPTPDGRSGYADILERESKPFKRTMRKLLSYVGAGPVGPNKYWEYPWVMRNLDLKPGLKILDAGCGRAPLQFLLAELGMEMHGIDPNENVGWHGIDRRLAAKYGLTVHYKVEGMEHLSYPDEMFDRVMSVSVLEHCRALPVKNDRQTPQCKADFGLQGRMLSEMARVLKKGGRLLVTLDVMFPDAETLLECNLNVVNLIQSSGLTLQETVPEGFYGQPDFDIRRVMERKNLSLEVYEGHPGTSLALIFRKE